VRRAVLLAALALATAACGDTDDGGEDAVEAMVLETCAPGGDAVESEICRCAYDELRQRLSAEELERLDRQLRDDPDTVPAEVQEVVLACGFGLVAPPTTKATTSTSTSMSSSTTSTTTTRSSSSSSSTSEGDDDLTTTTRRP
jgi:hypothetical protein